MPENPAVQSFDAAMTTVLRWASSHRPGGGDEVPLLESAGRVLAEPVVADRDQPPFDRSTRDGFAVRASEFSGGLRLTVLGEVRAGEVWQKPAAGPCDAIAIMTGAPLPAGTDAVAMVEHIERDASTVQRLPERVLSAGENVVRRGVEAVAGAEVLLPGTRMGAAEIALAASCGRSQVKVFARPTVAVIATGDELVELSQRPDAQQIRNSNSYALSAMVERAGGVARRLPIAPDLREELRERVEQARCCDLILFSGGVSMGVYDLVEEVLAEAQAEFFFTGVKMQPGKPVVFGRLPARLSGATEEPERLFFGLPGNPVSTQVTFHCFVEPLLRAMSGEAETAPVFVQATLTQEVAGKPGLMRLLPAHLVHSRVRPEVRLVGWQGSGDLAANARANCYAVLPPEESFRTGDVITVLLR